MPTLPNTFCVFILTHGRPDNVVTFGTLERRGYTGRLYLVVDDEDKSIGRYRENFGAERVIVFDKRAEAELCDEGNNFGDRRTPLMARNACFGIARRLGVTHFLQLDDDYKQFKFRFENKLGYEAVVKDINRLFASFLEFYESTPTLSVALSQGGDHIGGFDGTTRLKRKAMNSFFCSTKRPFRFVGAMNDDVNTYTTLGSRGELFFTFTSAQLDQKETQQQPGGITEMYLRFGTYCKAFTTVMMLPSAVRVSMFRDRRNKPRLHHAINWGRAVPRIVPERYRKAGAGAKEGALLGAPAQSQTYGRNALTAVTPAR
jgi:hypothetical protein